MDLYNASFGEDEEPEMAMTMEEFDEAKAELEHAIERGDAAVRLANNPDFQKLMLEGYFGAEVKRLTGLITSGAVAKSVVDGCAASLDAIGKCRIYFKTATEEGHQAREELKALVQARDEALEAAAEGETQGE